MQTDKLPRWASLTGILLGLALLVIGGRFLLAPQVAERGYGLIYNQPNNAFHAIKGIRDLFSGLLFVVFSVANWHKPLATVALLGSLIPLADMVIVLTAPQAVAGAEWIHATTVVALWVFGFFLLRHSSAIKPNIIILSLLVSSLVARHGSFRRLEPFICNAYIRLPIFPPSP